MTTLTKTRATLDRQLSRPDGPEMSAARRIWTLFVLCFAVGLVVGTITGFYAIAPDVGTSTGATQTQLTWMVDAYTLGMAGLLLPAGAISDRFGRRGVMNAGLVAFVVAAACPLFFDSPEALIASRGALGVAAAFVLPSTLSLITSTFPERYRNQAIGIWTAAFTMAGALGIVFTGLFLMFLSWHATFWVFLIWGAVTLSLSLTLRTSKDDEPPPLDVWGTLTSAVSITALVFGLIEAGMHGWGNARIIAAFLIGLGSAALFVLVELRHRAPLLDVRLFAIRPFGSSAFSVTIAYGAVYGLFFMNMQFLQYVLGYEALVAGLAAAAMATTVIPISLVASRITERLGLAFVSGTGCLLQAGGYVVLLFAEVDSSYLLVLLTFMVIGTGCGFNMAPCTSAIIDNVPAEKQGVAAAVNHTTRELGTALGVALIGGVLSATFFSEMRAPTAALPGPAQEVSRESVGGALAVAEQSGPAGAPLADAARSAFVASVHQTAVVLITILVVSAVIAYLWAPGRARGAAALRGVVTAGPNRPLGGVGVVLTDLAGRQLGVAHTDEEGRYVVPIRQPGQALLVATGADVEPRAMLVELGAKNGEQPDIVLRRRSGC